MWIADGRCELNGKCMYACITCEQQIKIFRWWVTIWCTMKKKRRRRRSNRKKKNKNWQFLIAQSQWVREISWRYSWMNETDEQKIYSNKWICANVWNWNCWRYTRPFTYAPNKLYKFNIIMIRFIKITFKLLLNNSARASAIFRMFFFSIFCCCCCCCFCPRNPWKYIVSRCPDGMYAHTILFHFSFFFFFAFFHSFRINCIAGNSTFYQKPQNKIKIKIF